MFHVGDLIIYSAHGVCQIDDICEKTFAGITRNYYTVHPLEGNHLSISIPVNQATESVLKILNKEDAEAIIESFQGPGIAWIEKNTARVQTYHNIINTAHRQDIADIVNTLMKKKLEVELHDKKFSNTDHKLLAPVQKILFQELAIALDTTYEDILKQVNKKIQLGSKAVPHQ